MTLDSSGNNLIGFYGSSSSPVDNLKNIVNQSNSEPIMTESNWLDSMIGKANKGDVGATQWLANYWATKESEKTARDWSAEREDNAYQRLNEDLKKAGISPYVLSGATPMVSNSTGKSYSGSDMTSSENNRNTTEANKARGALMALGVILSALIHVAMI